MTIRTRQLYCSCEEPAVHKGGRFPFCRECGRPLRMPTQTEEQRKALPLGHPQNPYIVPVNSYARLSLISVRGVEVRIVTGYGLEVYAGEILVGSLMPTPTGWVWREPVGVEVKLETTSSDTKDAKDAKDAKGAEGAEGESDAVQ